jgi:CRP-like cAMP-binding protein
MSSLAKSNYENNIEVMFRRGREKTFPKNQIVCYQGDPLTSIHLVKKGFLKA